MKKYLVCLVAAAFLAAALPALAMDAPAAPLKLVYFPKKVVMYPHSAHTALKCEQCHHQPDANGNPQKCTTAGCHDVFDKKDKSEKSLYNVIHSTKLKGDLQSCLQCHKAEAKKAGDKEIKKALTGCSKSKCHP